jgi:hypothetical protein|tara:strand:- start:5198 stop:5560 length:363 start_codon:yes stop_codon:yes gene_type:complete
MTTDCPDCKDDPINRVFHENATLLKDRNHTIALLRAKNERLGRRCQKLHAIAQKNRHFATAYQHLWTGYILGFIDMIPDIIDDQPARGKWWKYFRTLQPGLNYMRSQYLDRKARAEDNAG